MTCANIRKPAPRHERVRNASIGHPGAAVLREAGISHLGIDDRARKSAWGERLTPSHMLFFVVKGTVGIESLSLTASAGQCLLVPAAVSKRLCTPDGPMRAVWVHFREQPWTGAGNAALVFPAPGTNRIDAICEALLDETLTQLATTELTVRYWADLLLIYLWRQFPDADSPGAATVRQRLDTIWSEVSSALHEPWTVTILARRAHMSEGHFHRRVRHVYGLSPMAIVRRLRLERASALLRVTHRKLDDIASEVGYSTGYALSNAFARDLHCRPGELRHEGLPRAVSSGASSAGGVTI